MAISRFKTSTLAQGLPKYQDVWDGTTAVIPSPPVAGPFAWWDASYTASITTSASAVTEWADISGNNHTLVQTTSTQRPASGTRTVNGRNALDFDGTNDFLKSNEAASTWNLLHNATGATFFYVIKADTATVSMGMLCTSNDTAQAGIWNYLRSSTNGDIANAILSGSSNNFVALEFGTPGATYATGTTVSLATALDPSNGTAAARTTFYKNNNTAQGTFSQSQVSFTTSNAANTLAVGAFPGATGAGSDFFDGLLCEVLIYSGVLSSANIGTIQSYLTAKWGI